VTGASFPPDAPAAVLFAARHLLPVAGLGLVAWLLGRRLCRRVELAEGAEAAGVPLGLGLAVLGCALFVLGLAGQLRVLPVTLLLAVSALAAWREAAALARAAATAARSLREDGWRRAAPAALCAALCTAALAPVVGLALYPPTGYDANVYHLPFARAFADAGGLVVVPELRFPVFPVLMELLFSVGLMAGGEVTAQAVALLPTAAATLAAAAWAGRTAGPRAAWWAAALWLGNPLVVWMAGQAYVDLGLAAFTVLGLAAWDRWRRGGAEGWLTLSAVFFGAACAVKYHGLFFLALVGAAVAVQAWRERRVRPVLCFAGVSLLVAAPWYVRIYRVTGNPLFPFFQDRLGGPAWHTRFDRTLAELGSGEAALTTALTTLVDAARWIATLPWTSTVDRAAFDFEAPLSPWLYLLLPAVALRLVRRDREVAGASAVVAIYLLAAALSPLRSVRFLLPVVAVLAAASAVALVRLGRASSAGPERRRAGPVYAKPRRARRAAVATASGALILAAPGLLYTPYKTLERGPLPLDDEARTAYLRNEVAGFAAVDWLDGRGGGGLTVYAFQAPYLRGLFRGRLLGEPTGTFRYGRVQRALRRGPPELYRLLRGFGASHLLVPRGTAGGAGLDLLAAGPCFEPVYEDTEARVWALGPPSCTAAYSSWAAPPPPGGAPGS